MDAKQHTEDDGPLEVHGRPVGGGRTLSQEEFDRKVDEANRMESYLAKRREEQGGNLHFRATVAFSADGQTYYADATLEPDAGRAEVHSLTAADAPGKQVDILDIEETVEDALLATLREARDCAREGVAAK